MNKEKMELRYSEDEVNWDELAGIGILKDELEQAGELMTLLSGEKTGVLSLSLVLLGANVELDATLQLVREKGEVLIEIMGIEPERSEGQ